MSGESGNEAESDSIDSSGTFSDSGGIVMEEVRVDEMLKNDVDGTD